MMKEEVIGLYELTISAIGIIIIIRELK